MGGDSGKRRAIDAHFAGDRSHHAADRLQQRRLARTIGTKQHHRFALGNIERYAVNREMFAVADCQCVYFKHAPLPDRRK
ncbi:hypothetical protein D3C71_1741950 [compost metagenome]